MTTDLEWTYSLLEKASRKSEAAEVYYVASEDVPVGFEANRFKLLQRRQSRGVALRLILNGRVGLAATTRLGDADELVQAAADVSRFGAEARFVFPGPQSFPELGLHDAATELVPVGRMVEIGQTLIDRLREHTPEIQCEGGVSRGSAELRIANTSGLDARYRKSFFSVGISGLVVRGTDMLYVGDSHSGCGPEPDYGFLAERAAEQIERSRSEARIRSGQLPVILTSHGVASLLAAPLSLAFNGKLVHQGSSPLVGRLGSRIFDSRLSVWDDCTLPARPSSAPFDDEGVVTQRTPLVDRGIAANLLYDLQTGGLAGRQSTGSGHRGLESLPSPASGALIFDTGDASFDDMVGSIKEGLIVEYVIGATQGNVLGGDFGGNVLLGYKIENGSLVGRVKDTMISGNVYDILNKVTAIGREGRWVGSSLYAPSIFLSSVNISTKE